MNTSTAWGGSEIRSLFIFALFKLQKAFIFSSRFSSKIPKLSLEQVQKMEFEAMFVFKEFFFSSLEMQRLSSTVD